MSNVNQNSFRLVGAGKTFLSPTDFIVQVDTSQGAVTLVLPKIETILGTYTTIQQFIGTRFVDISDNASVNNITIEGFEINTINGESSIVLNTNGVGGMISLIGTNQWNFVQNSVGGTGGGNYLLQELPTPSYPNYFDKPAIGQNFEYGGAPINKSSSYILLDNGDVVVVVGNSCILSDETIITSADLYSSDGTDPNDRAYFLAFKKSSTDSTKLELITYFKGTTESELAYIRSLGGNNRLISETEASAKFLYPILPVDGNAVISDSFYMYLQYNSTTNSLTLTQVFPFVNSITALELFNQLTGLSAITLKSQVQDWLYNGQLDGNVLMNGDYEGVVWFINKNGIPIDKTPYNYVVGINYLTGATYLTDAIAGVVNLTNFTTINVDESITDFISHPKGVIFYLNDGFVPNNGNNNLAVTGIFSTFWVNNTQCVYLNARSSRGEFCNTNGEYSINGNPYLGTLTNGFYDKEYIFQMGTSLDYYNETASNIILWRWKLDSQDLEFETVQIPLAWTTDDFTVQSIASKNGYFLLVSDELPIVGEKNFSPTLGGVFWSDKEANPVQLKSNHNFISALLNSESYNLIATNYWMGYLVMIDSYNSVKF